MKYCFTLLLIVSATVLFAQQPGTIDKSYGNANTGIVMSAFNNFFILSSSIQSDNKLLLGGSGSAVNQLGIVRHNEDGSVDTSFGKGGQASSIDISGLVQNIGFVSGSTGVAVQPDGKIVAAGYVEYGNPDILFDNDIVVARFLPDGTPDESFGSGGVVITELGHLEIAYAVSIQQDGKIVVAGQQVNSYNNYGSSTLIVRYNTDGTLDNSFGGGNGYVVFSPADQETTAAFALLIQPDGNIVAGGSSLATNSFFLVRYLTDGSLDQSFGNGGEVLTTSPQFGYGAQINSLALDDKGRIAAAGIITEDQGVEVARYLPDGSLDNSFNKTGQVQLNFNGYSYIGDNVSTVLEQPGDKLVICSALFDHTVTPVLSGLNEDGSPDLSFGVAGQTITNIELYEENTPAVMQSDGKIIVAGTDYNSVTNASTYLLTRYFGYPQKVSLAVRIKRFIHNHSITWNGLPAEDKVAYYSVEQSSSNRTGFLPIAKLSGRSNLQDYSISNSNLLPGTNYYRVKAVSTDGVVRYSEVVSADNMANSASVFPNPARSSITVQGLPNNETANISIKDGSGTVLSQGVSNGSTQYHSSLANLQPGTYYMNITTTTKTETLKFVKQ